MPLLDVSDAILDPMFCDELTVTRRPYTTSDEGRVVATEQTFYVPAVVTQGNPSPMEQQPDDQIGKSFITVHAYDFQLYDPITGSASSYLPDIINYNGNRYIVTSVLNWSQYGNGFTMAAAMLYNVTQAQQ